MENSENVKVNNRNKRESIVRSEGEGGGQTVQTRKDIQRKSKYYYMWIYFL